jgi:hypothetical protein
LHNLGNPSVKRRTTRDASGRATALVNAPSTAALRLEPVGVEAFSEKGRPL